MRFAVQACLLASNPQPYFLTSAIVKSTQQRYVGGYDAPSLWQAHPGLALTPKHYASVLVSLEFKVDAAKIFPKRSDLQAGDATREVSR